MTDPSTRARFLPPVDDGGREAPTRLPATGRPPTPLRLATTVQVLYRGEMVFQRNQAAGSQTATWIDISKDAGAGRYLPSDQAAELEAQYQREIAAERGADRTVTRRDYSDMSQVLGMLEDCLELVRRPIERWRGVVGDDPVTDLDRPAGRVTLLMALLTDETHRLLDEAGYRERPLSHLVQAVEDGTLLDRHPSSRQLVETLARHLEAGGWLAAYRAILQTTNR